MKKADTNSATAAKPSRMFRKASMRPAMPSSPSAATSVPVTDSIPSGRTRCTRAARSEADTPSAATMSMLSTSSPVPEHLGGDVDVERGQAGTEEVVRLAEGEDPDDLDLWLRAVGQQDRRVVADGEAVVGCRASVDRDLAEAVGGPTFVEGRRPQPVLMAPRHPDERGAGGRERLALEVDELRVPTERRLRGVDTLHLADLLDQVGWHSTSRGRRLTAVEVRLGPHRYVDTGGDVLEELVDRPLGASR